jgi:hypothetical protein
LRRITKAALGGVASCALILGGTQVATGLSAVEEYNYSRELTDLQPGPDTVGPLDGASATLRIKETPLEGTWFKLRVTGIDPSVKDEVFGAHLHTGACVEGNVLGTLAGPHYNQQVAVGGKKYPHPLVDSAEWATVSTDTEAWFNVVSNAIGEATFEASVPFVPVDTAETDLLGFAPGVLPPPPSPGIMSIVIHVLPTKPDGTAGARQACLPLSVPQWNTPTS